MTGEKDSDILLSDCTFIDQGTWYNYIVFKKMHDFSSFRDYHLWLLHPQRQKDRELNSVLQCIKMPQYTRQVQHTEVPGLHTFLHFLRK